MAAWVVVRHDNDRDEVIGPFPAPMHAEQWRSRFLPETDVVEADEAPPGYHYPFQETEAYLRARA